MTKITTQEEEGDNWIPPQQMPDNDEIPSEKQGGIGCNPSKHKTQYSESGLVEEAWNNLQFKKRNYTVSVSVGLECNNVYFVKNVLSTGVGPSFIRKELLNIQ